MDSPARKETNSLIRRMAERPFDYDFYRAVRLLENQFPHLPRTGFSERLAEDFVRFGQNASLAFAPSVLESMTTGADGRAPRLFVHFLGLLGPNGPMPIHITEFVRGRCLNAKDPTMARFLDVFNHRILCLFYRTWASAQKSVDYDRPEEGAFVRYIGSLFGIGMKSLRNRDEIPDRAKLFFSGRLVCQTRNAEGLSAILQDFFGTPTEIQEFFGAWLVIPEANQCRLGESPETGALGRTAIAGSRKYEGQLKFRIRMGPMKMAKLQSLVPSGKSFQRVKAWVLNYIGYEYIWDLQCVVEASEVKPACLGMSGQLGWTSWAMSKAATKDAEDPIFELKQWGN
jgi:type VI secretion system protein ImpH